MCEDALVSRSQHWCHARAISRSRGSAVSQTGRCPRSTDAPKGPAPGPALAGPAPRAQSRPPASEQLYAPNARGDDIMRPSARHVARDVEVIVLAPSFIGLQWACNRSRGSESAAQSGSRCNGGIDSGVAAGCGSHLQWLQSAAKPRVSRGSENDSKISCSRDNWSPVVIFRDWSRLESICAHSEPHNVSRPRHSTSGATLVQSSGARTGAIF